MHFSTIITVWLNFALCHRIGSSENLFTKNQTISKENLDVLGKFFVAYKKVYLEKYVPRHVTVVGASLNDLEQVRPLFESYPHIICRETKKCTYLESFSQGSMVIIFLNDLGEATFDENIKILSLCTKCKVLFVTRGAIQIDDIWLIFTLTVQQNVPYSDLVHLRKNGIELYSDFVATNCSMEVRLVTVWSPGADLDKIKTWAFPRFRDLNGCPVSVSSLVFTPKMIIEENENGSLTIVKGREGELVLVIAEKLNFTVALRYPSVADQLKYSRKEAILNDVASGISEFGIGRLRPTSKLNRTIAISFPYDEECVTWGVPRVINWSNDIVWVEFSWEVWASVALIFVVSCVIGYVHRNTISSKTGLQKNLGYVTVFLEVIAIHLGNPVLYISSSACGRFILIAYIYYAMVITTAYKTSLASILATDKGTPKIIDAQGIIDANLDVGGSLYDYNILKDQVEDSKTTLKLLERFVVNNNDTITWDRLLFDKNYAFLARRSAMNYDRQLNIKAHEASNWDILNNCVLAYPTVMVFQVKSVLRKSVDKIIQRLIESGIMKHWDIDEFDADKILRRKSAENYFEKRGTNKFRNIFILYFFCIAVSLFTFFVELLTSKIHFRKLPNVANQVYNI